MVSEILDAAYSLMGLGNSYNQTKEEKDQLDQVARQNRVASGIWRGENILAEQGNSGLAGYQGMREEIMSEMPNSLNQFKDAASAGTLVDAIGGLQAKQDQALRTLSTQNEQQKMANRDKYASYLGNTVAGAQNNQMENNLQLQLAKIAAGQQGNKSQMGYISQLTGTLGALGDSDNSNWIAGLFGKKDPNKGWSSLQTGKPKTYANTDSEPFTIDDGGWGALGSGSPTAFLNTDSESWNI
jgi:hypothetical protein